MSGRSSAGSTSAALPSDALPGQQALPFPASPPTPAELLERAELPPAQRDALLLLIDQARTPRELRSALSLRTLRAAGELLTDLERLGLVKPVAQRGPTPAPDMLWELHPLFLVRFGQTSHHWRAT